MSKIVDQFGKPIQKKQLAEEVAYTSMTGIRSAWLSDSVASGLTPHRLASLLQSANQGMDYDLLTLAEEMEERELHYGSVLGTRKRAIEGLEIIVESGVEGDSKSEEIADAVRQQCRRAIFEELISDLLDALGKGRSSVEIMWDTGKYWEPAEFIWRDPRYFMWSRDSGRELRLIDEANIAEGVSLPPYKFITHVPKLKTGLPARNGLARLASVAYMLKSFTVRDWMAFSELFGMPIRVGRYGASAGPEDINTLRRAVANLGSDAAALIPDSMRVEFIERSNTQSGHAVFKDLAEFVDKGISKAVLGQTGTTEGTPGKLGSSSEMDDVRDDIKRADAKQTARTLNQHFVKPFVDLNFGVQQHYPRVQLFVPDAEDLKVLTDALSALVPLGLRVSQSVVRDKFGLPDPENDDDLLQSPKLESAESATMESAKNHAVGVSMNRQQVDDLDELIDAMNDDWRVVEPIIDELQSLVNECQTEQEFLQRLPELLHSQSADSLIQQLATETFKARGLGYAKD